jgi:drug/metabolite transporter (DMT)-like permease
MLCNATPVFILIWQAIVDRKLPNRLQTLFAAIVTAGAICYFYGEDKNLSSVGVIAGIVGGLTFSGFFFFQGKLATASSDKNALVGTVMLSDLLTVPTVLLCFLPYIFNLPAESPYYKLCLPVMPMMAIGYVFIAVLGLIQTGLAGWLMAKGQKGVDPMFMAFVPTLIMVYAPLLTWKFLGEVFVSPTTLFGFVLIHGGILGAAIYRARISISPAKPA